MSVFIDMLCDMLPMASALQNKNNDFRKVLDYTIGAYMEDKEPVFDELFLSSATGGWLDAFGRDYGVSRRVDEDDDSYRNRIIFEKLEYLTAENLKNIFGVELFNAYDGFDPSGNDLTSDNPYMTDWYVGITDESTQNILNNKFILGNEIFWYNGEKLDYIFNTSNVGILKNHFKIYSMNNYEFDSYFKDNTNIENVKLTLDNIISSNESFKNCTGLTDVKISLPKGCIAMNMFYGCSNLVNADLDLLDEDVNIANIFEGCTSLENVKLNVPFLDEYRYMFYNCNSLETIDVTIPNDKVSGFKSYVLGLDLANLTSFIINGEEVDLS